MALYYVINKALAESWQSKMHQYANDQWNTIALGVGDLFQLVGCSKTTNGVCISVDCPTCQGWLELRLGDEMGWVPAWLVNVGCIRYEQCQQVCHVHVRTIGGSLVCDLEVPCCAPWGVLTRPVARALGIRRRSLRLLDSAGNAYENARLTEPVSAGGEADVFALAAIVEASCASCSRISVNLQVCSGCLSATYCNLSCQWRHWEAHRVACSVLKQARACYPVLPAQSGSQGRGHQLSEAV